jgi:hypothetical protein
MRELQMIYSGFNRVTLLDFERTLYGKERCRSNYKSLQTK